MKIEFKNGSKIKSMYSNDVIREKRKKFYYNLLDDLHLKWWQKIYCKIYYWVNDKFN